MSRVELLAPAGDMECFRAAINAGADAVYMAGKSFGARANANNFTEEEFIEALNIAHIHGRRIYLTLNTLIKEREWDNIYSFIKPLYEKGLDGVIIQDMGLINYLSEWFPGLELHASTQMTITHSSSAALLKTHGICRVVPARELSLEEIKILKEKTGLEIECFVHGALCYSYSGQCLLSSYLGGRSGNRGRCAGPCRLPYSVDDSRGNIISDCAYPISLKDLCTIDHIAKLIEAGIDSFKIEGRMKSPEYVYGVTMIYRKYIDAYYAGTDTKVSEYDHGILESLYLRSSVGSGYYYNHNGRDMITLTDPSYNSKDDTVVEIINDRMKEAVTFRHLYALCYCHTGSELILTVWDEDGRTVTVTGDILEKASSRPATEEDIRSRLSKTGGTPYVFDSIDLDMDSDCFIPVKTLNECRRNALEEYTALFLSNYTRNAVSLTVKSGRDKLKQTHDDAKIHFQASIMQTCQLNSLNGRGLDRVYLPYDLIYSKSLCNSDIDAFKKNNLKTDIALSLPRIIRERDKEYINSLKDYLDCNPGITVLVRNLEELSLITGWNCNVNLIGDSSLYTWNKQAVYFYNEYVSMHTVPLELSLYEINDLEDRSLIVPVYGYASLMVTANCLGKTFNRCNGSEGGFEYRLNDRMRKTECTYSNCVHCYNELFNAVPTSLHNKIKDLKKAGYREFRLDFTKESERETDSVLDVFLDECSVNYEFTIGHYDKGAI